MNIVRVSLHAGLMLALAGPASAANGTVTFTGAVLSSCTILIGGAGVLDLGSTGRTLTTTEGLGSPALATVTTTGANYRFSVSTPTAFLVAPAAGNTANDFTTKFSLSGVTAGIDILGNAPPSVLNIGITNVKVDLTATHSTTFPSGLYTAQSVLTCE